MKMISLTVSAVTPMINGDSMYERLDLTADVDGETAGYAHINLFTPGAFKIGDKLNFTINSATLDLTKDTKKLKGAGQD